MQLTVLGCRSGMPADGQASSGYLVRAGATTLLLDCGPGVATAYSAATTPAELTAVVISHLHSDHCYDLLPLGKALLGARIAAIVAERGGTSFDAGRLLDRDGAGGVPLYVPEGGREVLGRLAALFPVTTLPVLDRAFEIGFDVREYRPGEQIELPDCRISLHPLRHAAPNCGVRIETASATLAYTGDTGMTDALDPLAHDVDMLLAEATLDATDTSGHGHLSAADAGRVAQRNGVRELVLTHFSSADSAVLDARRRAAATEFSGLIRIAGPGLRFPILARAGRR